MRLIELRGLASLGYAENDACRADEQHDGQDPAWRKVELEHIGSMSAPMPQIEEIASLSKHIQSLLRHDRGPVFRALSRQRQIFAHD